MTAYDDPMSTTQLVVASKEGDNEALGRLLEQYRGYLIMLAHSYLSERLRRRYGHTVVHPASRISNNSRVRPVRRPYGYSVSQSS